MHRVVGCSAIPGRDVADGCGEPRVRGGVDGAVLDLGARRVLAEEVVALPVARGADGAGDEAGAAVGADVAENVRDEVGAEGALVAADARLGRGGRQRLVAVFAGRSKLEQGAAPGR